MSSSPGIGVILRVDVIKVEIKYEFNHVDVAEGCLFFNFERSLRPHERSRMDDFFLFLNRTLLVSTWTWYPLGIIDLLASEPANFYVLSLQDIPGFGHAEKRL